MSNVITNLDQLTNELLTQLLQDNGLLKKGKVATITQTRSRQTNVSTVYFLTVTYTNPEPSAPRKLFLKIPVDDFHQGVWGEKEIRFYTEIVPAMHEKYDWNDLPFIRPYDVAYSEENQRSHYIFEDISDEFQTIDSPPPSVEHCEKVMEAFAMVHGFWWEHPRLFQDLGEPYTTQQINGFIQSAQRKLQDFIEFRGDKLAETHSEVLRSVVSMWPTQRVQRLMQHKGVTIVHRDPHTLNVLYSHDNKVANVKLIDWQSWRVDTGTDDIAYFMACHWPSNLRQKLEEKLVRHYHEKLQQHGVQDYTWETCWDDYRASVIRCLFFLMAAWSPKQWERGWWWDKLQLGIAAYQDLNCADLLIKP